MVNAMETIKKRILYILQTVKTNFNIPIKLLPVLSFITPLLILYSLYPESFEATWKGRTFYFFFLWLASLETILEWEKVPTKKVNRIRTIRTIALIVALLLPTIFVVVANFYGLNTIIVDLARENNVFWADWMPLSTEYLVFAMLFALIVILEYGINGLRNFSISTLFLGIIGLIYTIDNLYPYGKFAPFQIIVPTTATLAANVLSLMGYQTRLDLSGEMPLLVAWNPTGAWGARIAWPCAGVDSLLIYSITILLFLKNSGIPWRQRIIYFTIGAIVTYFINILRIATIFIIGVNGGDFMRFHNYYGPLYSTIWIISYPLIIIGSRSIWGKLRKQKASIKDKSGFLDLDLPV